MTNKPEPVTDRHDMPDVIYAGAHHKITNSGMWSGHKDTFPSGETEYLLAEPVKALLRQARGKLNASNYMGVHDETIAAIDKFLGEKK